MRGKLLIATALFTSSAAWAGHEVLEVTRVVTNGKGPTCAYFANAPEGIEPEVRDAATDRVLDADQYAWRRKELCMTTMQGGQQEVVLRFEADPTDRSERRQVRRAIRAVRKS